MEICQFHVPPDSLLIEVAPRKAYIWQNDDFKVHLHYFLLDPFQSLKKHVS